ncbi:FliI/YscN family ATPase [uncultured Sphingorhabdus sp.]|uniref:FliI/YscN family ATPase n=1 Tax=uncultured Sphingorhabdus sp. TaxID=1686106 RepID=UPI0026243F7F|nr:FliI/YscN family ATPase [uncultured Sphingorhabdus sp.]HMS19823.1 FliI/YscN family ATPase [Sphingorhabdus sp.]
MSLSTTKAHLQAIHLHDMPPRYVGRLAAHEAMLLEIEGFPAPLLTPVRISCSDGSSVPGEIVGFRGHRSLALPLRGNIPLAVGAPIVADGQAGLARCGEVLLGRVIDAMGRPLDRLALPQLPDTWPLAGGNSNPLSRGRVMRHFDCGVRAINALLSLGEGQRVALIAGSGVGKSVLMGQMLAGADCDVVVAGLIGERAREVSDFVEARLNNGMRRRTVVVATTADEAPLLRIKAAMRATAIAEYFRARGKRVLLLLDSLTRIAHAQREIGLALGEPPAMKGYPPSALGLIPQLVERAGNDRRSGGSITAIYTVLADGGDLEDPVVDAARAIVDGHIILSRSLAEAGVYPAIDIGRSLSRTMADIVDAEHRSAAQRFRQLWSVYEENRDLILMGAYTPGSDPLLDEAVARQSEMRSFITQREDALVPYSESRTALIEGFGT